MSIGHGAAVERQLQILFSVGTFSSLNDEQLLARFLTERGDVSERAFRALVERHGPMVLRVCRAVVGDEHDAQDAFQGTFLVLARRARSLRVHQTLAPWLYEVAHRTASSSRTADIRRRRHERKAAELMPVTQEIATADVDLERSLHDEIGRLPEPYRLAVVLCLLEGLSHQQAANYLGWPVGTVKSRLANGREQLRGRLIRRGLAPEAALAARAFASTSSAAALPACLLELTIQAMRSAVNQAAPWGIIASTVALTSIIQRAMPMITTFCAAAAVLGLGAIDFGPQGTVQQAVTGIRLTFVDLEWIGNQKLTDPLGILEKNDLAGVPRGPQKLGGAWFKIGERLVRVRGRESPEALREVPGLARLRLLNPVKDHPLPEPPPSVRSILIGARFDTLHILHSTMFGNAFGADDGTEIGTYIVHYSDRTDERIPIVYGLDVRDWWRSSDPSLPSHGRLAWSGKNAAAGDDDEIRLFASEWRNPHPDKEVVAIDFETKDTACAPFLVAMTLERMVHRRSANAHR